ncbi:hypothetical protein EI94DRAFT_1701582 [Lactarius quietus]|nr:hypothetical protein EI94DRAFT_1701582 [Lactarius quietus]
MGRVPTMRDILTFLDAQYPEPDGDYMDSFSDMQTFGVLNALDIMASLDESVPSIFISSRKTESSFHSAYGRQNLKASRDQLWIGQISDEIEESCDVKAEDVDVDVVVVSDDDESTGIEEIESWGDDGDRKI